MKSLEFFAMFSHRTDHDWQTLGQVDPYWAVLTDERFGKERLTDAAVDEFFASGEAHVAAVFEMIRQYIAPGFQPTTALDFGCGVGRILIPLAQQCQAVTGVDVAPAMLAEARRRSEMRGLTNVRLVTADDALSAVRGTFDFIHSYIVFQHIPPSRGQTILRRLLERLKCGGVGALHFPYRHTAYGSASWLRAAVKQSRLYPLLRAVRNVGMGLWHRLRRTANYRPPMQMNCYDLNTVVASLHHAGVRRLHVKLLNDDGILGALLLFQKEM